MPTQSARSRSRSRGCDRSKSSQTLTLLQVTTLNTAQHSAAQHPIPSHSDQSTVTGGDQLPVASCQSRQRMSGQKGEHKRHRMRTISSAAASERVRVMEGNEGVDRPKGKRVWRVGGVGVTFEARCRGKGNMKTTDYDAEWRVEPMLMPVCPERYHNKLGNEIFTK